MSDKEHLNLTTDEQVAQLRLVLREMLILSTRLTQFRPKVGLTMDISNEIAERGPKRLIHCDDEYSDAMLTIDGISSIICCGITQKAITGDSEVLGFVCGKIIYDPGVHRYPDGSGEPPSEDFVEEYSTRSPREAAVYLLKTIFDIELSQVAQSLDEDEMVKQMGEDAKEAFG